MEYSLILGENAKQKITHNEFLSGWNGVILAIEPNEVRKYKSLDWDSIWLKYSLPVLILIILSIIHSHYRVSDFILLFTSLIGVVISIFIVQEKLGFKNQIVSKICNINPNTSCNSVIKSEINNKFFGFSDLPLLFFSISFLSIIVKPITSNSVSFLSLASIPVIFYSIWLQKAKLKKWCIMCLAISFIIVLQSFIFFVY